MWNATAYGGPLIYLDIQIINLHNIYSIWQHFQIFLQCKLLLDFNLHCSKHIQQYLKIRQCYNHSSKKSLHTWDDIEVCFVLVRWASAWYDLPALRYGNKCPHIRWINNFHFSQDYHFVISTCPHIVFSSHKEYDSRKSLALFHHSIFQGTTWLQAYIFELDYFFHPNWLFS